MRVLAADLSGGFLDYARFLFLGCRKLLAGFIEPLCELAFAFEAVLAGRLLLFYFQQMEEVRFLALKCLRIFFGRYHRSAVEADRRSPNHPMYPFGVLQLAIRSGAQCFLIPKPCLGARCLIGAAPVAPAGVCELIGSALNG